MYGLEVVFVQATMAFLLASIMPRMKRRTSLILFAVGLLAALSAFALGQARIHMAPAALLFIALSLLLLKRGHAHVAIRVAGVVLGLLLTGVSVALSLALPVVALPAPEGPHTVGVTSFTLVDDSRNESAFGAPERSREIYVQTWYPGRIPDEGPAPRVRTLWEELYPSAIGKVLFGYLGGMETHSYEDIPISSEQDSYPAIVFSHALSGIAEQNTLLTEHLASHGYIVFGVTHPYFGMAT